MTSLIASVPQTIDSPPAPQPMSYEEYLTLDWTAGLVEWVDGEAIFHMPPLDEHQTLVEMLHLLMGSYVQLLSLGKLRVAPFAMRAAPAGPAREPDLFFLATENLG
nr:Uma2 family endonuclease [Chloroflexaceae bacterium]